MSENETNNGFQITGLELSPRKAAYLKYLLTRTDAVRTSEISENFDVEPSTVTKLINELAEEGYIDHIPYRGVRLTETGKIYAEFCLKRHQILGLVFSHYGLSPDAACEEITRFETFVSKSAIDTICASMGHPTTASCTAPGEIKQIKHISCLDDCKLHNHL
ncbi:HTH-type transcriptional regulator MntR [Methanosarcinaceae archaeon Ag5]|uniref:HTH-type transcriptional regulator MntR n=1 Tax=Methanolapillus africanus TaxID=3028297 RepID=A0AAE4SEJ7_9EURY|nr:HTH-type transcriptional regulator MntR [Methanosarcinaceae archaeon Ag5]